MHVGVKRAAGTKFGKPSRSDCSLSVNSAAAAGRLEPPHSLLAADLSKERAPSYSFGRRDGISPETFAKSKLGKLRDRKAQPKR
jgi:hypothetical protein